MFRAASMPGCSEEKGNRIEELKVKKKGGEAVLVNGNANLMSIPILFRDNGKFVYWEKNCSDPEELHQAKSVRGKGSGSSQAAAFCEARSYGGSTFT